MIASIAPDRLRPAPLPAQVDRATDPVALEGLQVPMPFRNDRSAKDRSATPRARAAWIACLVALFAASAAHAGAPGPEPDEPTDPASSSSPPVEGRLNDVPVLSDVPRRATPPPAPRPVLDPSARLQSGDDASEAWTLFVDLDTGHRITQRFLLTNTGPGEHSAVAVGHLVEPGRTPYRYENGRRRARWTLSDDRLFFDIAASHLDLHRPQGELRITKDDIEIRLFFAFAENAPSARVPTGALPADYHVDVLAIGAVTRGTIHAPWMSEPLAVRGRTWLVHTWTPREEARLLARRTELFGANEETSFYGLQLRGNGDWSGAWSIAARQSGQIIESPINVPDGWREHAPTGSGFYPTPTGFDVSDTRFSGEIALDREWLRFDPLEVIPQPFRWFIRRRSRPQEVWADARIRVSLSSASGSPALPHPDETTSADRQGSDTESSRAKRETDEETSLIAASGSSNGVASITFLNPVGRR